MCMERWGERSIFASLSSSPRMLGVVSSSYVVVTDIMGRSVVLHRASSAACCRALLVAARPSMPRCTLSCVAYCAVPCIVSEKEEFFDGVGAVEVEPPGVKRRSTPRGEVLRASARGHLLADPRSGLAGVPRQEREQCGAGGGGALPSSSWLSWGRSSCRSYVAGTSSDRPSRRCPR